MVNIPKKIVEITGYKLGDYIEVSFGQKFGKNEEIETIEDSKELKEIKVDKVHIPLKSKIEDKLPEIEDKLPNIE